MNGQLVRAVRGACQFEGGGTAMSCQQVVGDYHVALAGGWRLIMYHLQVAGDYHVA